MSDCLQRLNEVFQDVFDDDYPEDNSKIRYVLGTVVLAASPLSPSAIVTLSGFDTEDAFPILTSTHLVLTLQDIDHPVQPIHWSFRRGFVSLLPVII